jgi:glycosyltransferase involved in cell wall biosynthesis
LVGFYGVIDERIDLELVAGIADARPEWTVLMIGPLAKISKADLPHRQNIVYLGMRTYEQLPGYLARFDAAILPFAINEATRFISPTKTLEYLSGGKPVVSTAIKDVIDLYGDVIEVASGPEEFVHAIERLWQESPEQRALRSTHVKQTLEQHDWDLISSSMLGLLHGVLSERAAVGTQLTGASVRPAAVGASAATLSREMAD